MGQLEIDRPKSGPLGRASYENSEVRPHASTDVSAGAALPRERMKDALRRFDSETQGPVTQKLLKNALILVKNREFHLALNILRNISVRDSNHPEILKWMGHCLKETGQYEEALKCMRAVVKLRRSPESLQALADTLYLMEKDEEAFECYQQTLSEIQDSSPLLFDIYKALGNIHVRAGDFDAAEESYNKAYTIKADSDALMVNYGTLEIQRDNLSAAIERFRAAVWLNSENDKAWVGLALVHRQMGDLELGWANLERALDINSTNKTALRLTIEWGAQDRAFEVAIKRIPGYLARHGQDAEMSFTFAKILVFAGRLNEALLETERTIALEPGMPGAAELMTAIRQHQAAQLEP